jgi:dihydropteroate synthase
MKQPDDALTILQRLEPALSRILDEMAGMKSEMIRMGGEQARMGGEQARMSAEQTRVAQVLERLDDRMTAAEERAKRYDSILDVAELRGRVEEISRRMPTSLAYVPAPARAEVGK